MGIVYAAINKSIKGNPVKIGMTAKSIEDRMKGLNAANVLEPYICLYALDVGDKAKEIEKLLHKAFKKK